ncbi:MAG: GldG family protein, partial [Myxococcales bacterium]|nr:GldG family protein [Myxococcales bacterium]
GIAALLGGLGLVFFGFGLIQFVIWIFQPFTNPLWLWLHLGVGAALLVAAVGTSLDALRERMRSGEGRRAGRYGTSALLQAALLVAILCGLAFLAERYSKRFDWTEQRVHTLSDQTQKVLDGLEGELSMVGFFDPFEQPLHRQIVERYAAASPRVKIEFADPNARPDLVESFGLQAADLARGMLHVSYGGGAVDVSDLEEDEITNAIVKLVRGGGKKVYFLTGHNERRAIGDGADEPDGMSRAAAALRNETYTTENLLLGQTGDVPADADVVVVAGPTRPLLDVELDALRRWVAGGGALVAMIDPRANTNFGALLGELGVAVGDDVVFDRSLALFGRATSPFAASYAPDHPITKGFQETSLFHMARSVAPEPGVAGLVPLVKTGEASWAETNLAKWEDEGVAGFEPESDTLGPVSLAVAGVPRIDGAPEHDPRLVAFGDSNFATNELVDSYLNRDLFVNSVAWAMGEVEHIAVRPHKARASRLSLSAEQFSVVQMLSLFVLPEAIAVAGVLAWWTRRKRGTQ